MSIGYNKNYKKKFYNKQLDLNIISYLISYISTNSSNSCIHFVQILIKRFTIFHSLNTIKYIFFIKDIVFTQLIIEISNKEDGKIELESLLHLK